MTLPRTTLLAVGLLLLTGTQLAASWEEPQRKTVCPIVQVPVPEYVTVTVNDLVLETVVLEDVSYRFSTTTRTSIVTTSKHVCETVTVQPVGFPDSLLKTVVVPLTINYNDLSLTGITSTVFSTELDTITSTTNVIPTVTHYSVETRWDSLQYTVVTYTKEHVVKAFTATKHPTQVVTSEQVATQWVTRLRTVTDPTPILITKFPTQHITAAITKTWEITSTVCVPSPW